MPPVTYHQPTSREIVAELLARVERIDAAAETLKSLTVTRSASPAMLTDALRAIERHLALAVHDAERARERIPR
jgi:hypothetical protein